MTIALGIFINEKAKELANEMMYDSDNEKDDVGGEVVDTFIFDDKEYSIKVEAFWEKQNWLEWNVVGIGFEGEWNGEIYNF